MSLLALVPALVFVIGAAAVAVAFARFLDEAQQLRMELRRAQQLSPMVARVGDDTLRLRLALHRLNRRRP